MPWLTAFALLGLAASSASTWVHYQILNDPIYASFCDVNATFSCTEAYTSRFGAFGGVPVALSACCSSRRAGADRALCAQSRGRRAQSCRAMCSPSSTLGLAAVLYLAYASFFILKSCACSVSAPMSRSSACS